jgi:hypothetical protein
MITEALAAFQGSYLARFDKLYPDPALFALAARLFDLQRNAVLITMQKGKVTMARRKMPIAGRGTWQSSGQPMYAAFAGNGKAVALPATRPRTAVI